MRTLVTGGVRSGKSRHAVELFADIHDVTFVAPGSAVDPDDPDWERRIAHHRESRPGTWSTLETSDLTAALDTTTGPVLVDCLATWVTATVDELGLWEAPADEVRDAVAEHTAALGDAVARHESVVLVTNEVGSGVVPAHRSGSLFRDLLGAVNQTVAQACDEVHLVVCGRVLRL